MDTTIAAVDNNAVLTSQYPEHQTGDVLGSDGDQAAVSIRTTLFGALRKVKSKIQAEIDGVDATDAQREDERFEKQWLGEFERLRVEYQTKWDTCTHSADEFCGLLFHCSDEQQQAYLLREYPTLMESWRDADLTSSSLRVRPDWPAARIAYDAVVDCRTRAVTHSHDPAISPPHTPLSAAPSPPLLVHQQRVETSPSLRDVLSLLRVEFQWPEDAVHALTLRLEAEQIFSCAELLACMTRRHGAFFERTFQSRAYPRLTKSICRRLHSHAHELELRHESVRELSMEPLRVNPQ